MFEPEFNPNLPPQIEASLQFLRFARCIEAPASYGGETGRGRRLSKPEAEVYDSSLTMLLEYFAMRLDPTVPHPIHRHEHDH